MGTYIIHFDDKPWQDLDDEQYYRCKEIPWFSTTKTTISRLTPYTEDAAYAHGYTEAESKYREIRDELEKQAYQRGLADAWDAARKIAYMYSEERKKIFGENLIQNIHDIYSASEAIEKIRQYEQEKEEEIQVGDEVITASGKAVVMGVGPVHFEYVYADGSHGYDEVKNVKKTGRHFPEFAELLQKMREGQEQ